MAHHWEKTHSFSLALKQPQPDFASCLGVLSSLFFPQGIVSLSPQEDGSGKPLDFAQLDCNRGLVEAFSACAFEPADNGLSVHQLKFTQYAQHCAYTVRTYFNLNSS